MSVKDEPLTACFPWFGGKRQVAPIVWKRCGVVRNYVEPFFGGGAVMLGRPQPFEGTETINDADGYVANFWRAVAADPEAVANYADWPVTENDLHARHIWLVERREEFTARMDAEPDYFDVKVAGWWCWGLCCWIGSGWCSGDGPWRAVENAEGVRQLVHLGNAGRGVNRQLVHLGDAGQGVNRKLVHLGDAGREATPGKASTASESTSATGILDWMERLAARLARVRVCCGDWSRVCGPTVTVKQGLTAVLLDPPYAAEAERTDRLYRCDSLTIANGVREWCIANGDNPKMRIALCGYDGEHQMPDSWECYAWKAKGGYASQSEDHDNPNARKERIWFSKFCIKPDGGQRELF